MEINLHLNEHFGSEHSTVLNLIALCTDLIFYMCISGFSTAISNFKVFEAKNHSFTGTVVLPLITDGQCRTEDTVSVLF